MVFLDKTHARSIKLIDMSSKGGMIVANLATAVSSLVDAKKYATIRDILSTMNAADIALLFDDLPSQMIPLLFRLLPKELAAMTFVEMETDQQELLVKGFSDSELKEVIDELYIDDAVDIVEEMPANVVRRILGQADPDTRKMINELMKYPEDSAGSIMTVEFVELRPNLTVEDAIKAIRRTGVDKETINICYVTRADRTLYGFITIRRLILANPNTLIGDLADTNVIYCSTMDDQETVAKMLQKYDLVALPVVDGEKRLVGIVTIDDAIDVLQDEVTEDIEKMAAMTPSDKPYLKTSTVSLFLHRIPWLGVLMLASTFTELIINYYTQRLSMFGEIAGAMLLACIPMLMGTGGNSGSQSSTLVIRGMATGELELGDFIKVMWKEIRVGVIVGICLSILNYFRIVYLDHNPPLVAITVCVSMILIVIIAKLIGSMLPMVAKKIGIDPALMAGPMMASITDMISLCTYFIMAGLFLHI